MRRWKSRRSASLVEILAGPQPLSGHTAPVTGTAFDPAGSSLAIRLAEICVREGGRYRLTMQPPGGQTFHLTGKFREVEPPRRLVYTLEYEEPDPHDQEIVVTLSFVDDAEGTRLVLDQGPFATKARHALHVTGWTETLERLERFLA